MQDIFFNPKISSFSLPLCFVCLYVWCFVMEVIACDYYFDFMFLQLSNVCWCFTKLMSQIVEHMSDLVLVSLKIRRGGSRDSPSVPMRLPSAVRGQFQLGLKREN